jgi:hypothetical protein
MSNIENTNNEIMSKNNKNKPTDSIDFQFICPADSKRLKKEKTNENSLDDSAMTSVGNESENSRKLLVQSLSLNHPAGIDIKNSSEESLEEGEVDDFRAECKEIQHLTRKHKRSESADDEIPFNRNFHYQKNCLTDRIKTNSFNTERSLVPSLKKNKFTLQQSNENDFKNSPLNSSDEDDYTKIINSRLKRDNFQLNLNGLETTYFLNIKNENITKKISQINDANKSQIIQNSQIEEIQSFDPKKSENFIQNIDKGSNQSNINSKNYSANLELNIRKNLNNSGSIRSQSNLNNLNEMKNSNEFFEEIDPELNKKIQRNYQCQDILNKYKNYESTSSPLKNACLSLSESQKKYREVHEEEKIALIDKQKDTEEKLNTLAQNSITKHDTIENRGFIPQNVSKNLTNKTNETLIYETEMKHTDEVNSDNKINTEEKNVDMSEICGIMSLPDDREQGEMEIKNLIETNSLGTQHDIIDINAIMTIDQAGNKVFNIFNNDTHASNNSNSLISDINRTQTLVIDDKDSIMKEETLENITNFNNSQIILKELEDKDCMPNLMDITIDDLNRNNLQLQNHSQKIRNNIKTLNTIDEIEKIDSITCSNKPQLREFKLNSSYLDSTYNKKPNRKKGPQLYPTFFKEDKNVENYQTNIMEIDEMMRAISINDETKKRMRMNFMNQIPRVKNKKDAYFNHSFLFFYLNSFTFSSVLRKLKGREFKLNLILDIDSTLLHADYENKHLFNNQSKFPSYPVISPVISGVSHRLIVSIRKSVKKLLEYCSQFCNIYVYTHGQEAYA